MITIVKYEALKNANKILQSTLDSDILYKFQQTLTEIYEWLEITDANEEWNVEANYNTNTFTITEKTDTKAK